MVFAMKVTRWQQFSSNHSAEYTIVGVFDSVDEAKEATEAIRTMVTEIRQWTAQNETLLQDLDSKPTPIENHYAQKYNIDWVESIDWLQYDYQQKFREFYRRNPQDNISQYRNLVFVTDPGDSVTKQTGHQFANLVKAFGGKSFSYVMHGEFPATHHEIFSVFTVDLSCEAPDIATAKTVFSTLQSHFEHNNPRTKKITPWAKYNPYISRYLVFMNGNNYQSAEQHWIQSESSQRDLRNDDNIINIIISSIQYEVSLSIYKGSFSIEETFITLKGLSAGNNLTTALPALLSWLEELRCTVSFEITQRD
jgi:hypothetical protein